jgi:hypothetical protein
VQAWSDAIVGERRAGSATTLNPKITPIIRFGFRPRVSQSGVASER